MNAILNSRQWRFRILRIGVLTLIGWWAVKGLVQAQLPPSVEFPRTNFEKTIVDVEEIESGGPPKDGIPAIDKPKFVSPATAGKWLHPREPVIVVKNGGLARAYPLQILIYHEIVNDQIGDLPISVTFCPLCNSSIVFDRRFEGRRLDFGTTGRLRKSNLVMYDRQTETWWQQFSGRALVGDLAGTILERVPSSIVAFEDFERAYPEGEVLSRETGYSRPYGNNPYRGYDRVGDRPFLFRDPVDPRLPAMERVLGVSVAGKYKIYPFSVLETEPVINDEFAGLPIVVFSARGTLSVLDAGSIRDSRKIPSANAFDRRLDGRVLTFDVRDNAIRDRETGSTWNLLGRAIAGPLEGRELELTDGGVHFAFAWLAFSPDSVIYRPGG